jgi:hypothetical protein
MGEVLEAQLLRVIGERHRLDRLRVGESRAHQQRDEEREL